MAKTKQNGTETVPESNMKARNEIQRECAQRMREIKAERKDLNEDAAAIRERLQEAGINVKAFEAALRLADAEDTAARDDYLDGLRESLEALGVGEQGDFIAYNETKEPAPVNEPEEQATA